MQIMALLYSSSAMEQIAITYRVTPKKTEPTNL